MKILGISALTLSLLAAGVSVYLWTTTPKYAYIEIQSVYEGFQLKKDLEKKLVRTMEERKRISDSLMFELKGLSQALESRKVNKKEEIAEFQNKREIYLQKSRQFEEDNAALTKQYDEEIFTQLNQYVKDFGKESEYDVIFGSSGDGNMMYAVEHTNLTAQVMDYVNKRYSGRQ